jgi:sulfur carrier protein ThiS adenylyltransferase
MTDTAAFRSRNDPDLRDALAEASVGIAGCGGLGSNVAVMLARVGVGSLVLADHDVIEPSNLNRQTYDIDHIGKPKVEALTEVIRRFNPDVRLRTERILLDEDNIAEVFADCDIVVEAFDTAEAKAMITRAFRDPPLSVKKLVCASGMAGRYSSNQIETRRIAHNIYVCGDFEHEPDEQSGLMAPRVMLAAAHEANMVLRLIAGEEDA